MVDCNVGARSYIMVLGSCVVMLGLCDGGKECVVVLKHKFWN